MPNPASAFWLTEVRSLSPRRYTPGVSSFKLAPSVLSADFTRLGASLKEAQDAGADMIHVDVMDGHFVPNISMGPGIVRAIKSATSLPLDIHLMVDQPERHIEAFAAAGAESITVHFEVVVHLHRLFKQVRESGAKVGLALNPLTPVSVVEGALPYLDLALVMSVDPGFGGQEFIPGSIARIEALRRMRDRVNPNCLIEVDGGVNSRNAAAIVAAGADVLVAGSAVFGSMGSVAENVAGLRGAQAKTG